MIKISVHVDGGLYMTSFQLPQCIFTHKYKTVIQKIGQVRAKENVRRILKY